MRESWTDERLDDLKQEVRDGFDGVDERFDKMEKRFDKVDERFEAMQDRFDRKFDAMYQLIFRTGTAAIFALLGILVTQL